MSIYFSSFYPLCYTSKGVKAINTYNLKPYRDGSCRLEPDFEKEFPSITGLCRPGFSKKLKVGDIIIYVTNKTKGNDDKKLVAILKVIEKVSTHEEAEKWYSNKQSKLPNNIMVSTNNPVPLDHTNQMGGWDSWIKRKTLEEWNKGYEERSLEHPDVAICENIYCELETPPLINKAIQWSIFQRIPLTRNPPKLTVEQWNKFQEQYNIKRSAYYHSHSV